MTLLRAGDVELIIDLVVAGNLTSDCFYRGLFLSRRDRSTKSDFAVLGDDLHVPRIYGQLSINDLLSNIGGDADILFVFVLIKRRH